MNATTFTPDLIRSFLRDLSAHELRFECADINVCLIKVTRDDNNVYLYSLDSYTTFKNSCVSKNNKAEFAGVYNKPHDTLVTCGVLCACYNKLNAEAPAEQSLDAYAKSITQRIADRVIELIDDKPVPVTDEAEKTYNSVYDDVTARGVALDGFFNGALPHVYVPRVDFAIIKNYEDAMIASLDDPDAFVENESLYYVKKNANSINTALENYRKVRAEYMKLLLEENGDHYMRKAIAEAVKDSSAKTVNLDLDKDGKQLTVKIEARTMLYASCSYYSAYNLDAESRRRFEETFGRSADIFAKDIVRITYAKNAIYERKSSYIDHAEDGKPFVTMTPEEFERYTDEGIVTPAE